MFHNERSGATSFLVVEQKEPGIHESGKQTSSWLQYPKTLAPYHSHIGHEQIRNRMEDQIKPLGGKFGKILPCYRGRIEVQDSLFLRPPDPS